MAWDGWWEYAGQEFVNAQRTETYARAAGASWFRGCISSDDLGPIKGERYVSPWQDPAPWSDPDYPESYEFWGCYPLGITGVEDSTRVGDVVESVMDGGTVNRLRHATRAVVFNCLLVGASEAACEYGSRWLRRLLLGAACGVSSTESCAGANLCYLSSEPCVCWDLPGDEFECLDRLQRTLYRVIFNNGPTVAAKQPMTDGGQAWTVQFTGVAANPWEFTLPTPIVEGFGQVAQPYVSEPIGTVNMNGPIVDDTSCLTPIYQPVMDPSCPAVIPPPTVPQNVPIGCYTPPANWRRRQFTIPKEHIPLWMDAVPVIEIHAPTSASVRNIRLRFYADIDGDGDITDDICAYCGDIVVSYIPAGQTLVFDGAEQEVYVEAPTGIRRRADALVFATDGTPFTWPVLSCGFGYVVTVDLPQTATPPPVDLSLINRAA